MISSIGPVQLKVKIAVFCLIALLLSCFAAWFIFWPQWERIEQAKAEYLRELHQVQIIEAFASDHPNAADYLAELKQKQASIHKILPESAAVGEYLIQMEAAAKQNGVKLMQVKPSLPVDKSGYCETQLEVTTQGNFFQTLDFIKILDEGQRFTTIGDLSLHASQGILEGKMVIKIFSLRY